MLKPCVKRIVAPGWTAALIVSFQTSFCTWSGTKMPMMSAPTTASAGLFGVQPWDSARAQPSEPGRMPIVTSAPESRRLSACACPCDP